MNKWNKRFIELADHIAQWSKDTSTKVGCVIVDDRNRIVSTGYNGLPSGADDEVETRIVRPLKYHYTEHAERNAIFTAANLGLSLQDKKIYVSGDLFVCSDCARAIIQSGIKEVFAANFKNELHPRWIESNKIAYEMLIECGVKVTFTS